MSIKTKIITTLSVLLVLVGTVAFLIKFCFVFGEGVKAGELNRLVYKGYIFKTYEGYIIQAGFTSKGGRSSSSTAGAAVQSNEFYFSVKDKAIADSLMYHCGGKNVELHYKEYLGALPWRGKEKFVVDRIVAVHP
ncbi:MAG: hypothetical protein PUA47_03130 [Bacteroidales bacterium]|nr:hypothetical protein [Bacteroidales bacterium]